MTNDDIGPAEEWERMLRDVQELLVNTRTTDEDGQLSETSRWQEVIDNLDDDGAAVVEGGLWPIGAHAIGSDPDTDAEAHMDRECGDNLGDQKVLLVEDDWFTAQEYGWALSSSGLDVIYAFSAEDALSKIRHYGEDIFLVVLDIRMPTGDYFSAFETVGGRKTGVFLADEIIGISDSVNLVALSNSTDSLDAAWFEARDHCHFCSKRDYQPDRLTEYVQIYVMKNLSSVRCFVIHGHDMALATDLQVFLQQTLGFSHVTILARKKSKGMTVIEKLEEDLDKAHLIFALFTPDDMVVAPSVARRARQNVVFEFGYALGLHGRKSGRVFLLCKGVVEIPSDLKGMIYIDITNGIAAAADEIRMELADVFGS
jgi:predicted nucleotide-binding protein